MDFGQPVEDRAAAARRWRVALFVAVGGGAVGALLAGVSTVADLPIGLGWLGFGLLVVAVVGSFGCVVGIGWTRNLSWSRSLWLAVKVAGSLVKDLF